MQCPACQRDHPADARFCNACGAALSRSCGACGRTNPPDASFCSGCGVRLDAPAEPSPAPAPEAAAAAGPRGATPRAYTPHHLAERILRSRSALEGERRHVTVVFCDLLESTELAGALGPEEMHAIMDRAFGHILDEVHRYEGTVNQFLGDGAMALFGAPVALEDGPRRAVRAALGIQRHLAALDHELRDRVGRGFRMRIGIHSGPVVVGRIGDDLRMDYSAVGETTHLAARLEALAEPGSVVISDATAGLVDGFFELRDLGERRVKGRLEPVRAYQVVGERDVKSRLEASAAAGLSPFVGRRNELAVLEAAFEEAVEGRGQVVFLAGEAGLGKSRLLYELRRRLGERPGGWLEGSCASYAVASPFHPLVDGLRRYFGIEERDDDATALAKLDARAAAPELSGVRPLLRALLSLPSGDPAVDALEGPSRRSEIFHALRALVLSEAERGPFVLVVEDLHWIDAASEEFLGYLTGAIPTARVLVLLTHRPGYEHPFGDRSYHARVALRPLSAEETRQLARAALAVADVPEALREAIDDKAEGNPFFVEEVTRSLLEEGVLLRRGDRLELARPLHEIAIPDRIQDVLMARLDRLPEEPRRALQVASVIGREFALRLLERVIEAGDRVSALVEELRAVELVYEKALHPELAYMFKHALTHDVAYESVLEVRRKALHRVVGSAIEQLYPDRLGEHYDALAHHFGQGEDWSRAFHYHRLAGIRAAATFANQAAVAHLREALAIARSGRVELADAERRDLLARLATTCFFVSQLRDSAEAWEEVASLCDDPEEASLALGRAAYSLYLSHDYERMSALVRRLDTFSTGRDGGHRTLFARLHRGMADATLRGRIDPLAQLTEEGLAAAGQQPETAAFAYYLCGQCAEWRGDYGVATAHLREGIARAQEAGRIEFALAAEWFLGKALVARGRYGEANRLLRDLLDRVERLGDRALRARILNTVGWCYAEAGDHAGALPFNERSAEIGHELVELGLVASAPEIFANASINLAIDRMALGDAGAAEAAVARARDSVAAHADDPWMRWRYSLHLSDVEGRLALLRADPERALEAGNAELAGAVRHGVRKLEARALELRGRALLALDAREEAAAALASAVAVATELGHPPVRWRALALQGELARRSGDAADAAARAAQMRDVLATTAADAGDDHFATALRATAGRLADSPLAVY